MSLGSTIGQLLESILRNIGITSASRDFTNKVKNLNWFGETPDFDSIISADVVNIIKDEIKIQMTEVAQKSKESKGTNAESELKSTVLRGNAAIKNPMGALSSAVKGIPIPHAQLVALAAAMAPIIFELTTRDGGPLDLRFKRKLLKEQNSFLDRQTQRNTQIGLRQVVIQSRAGFIQLNGAGGNENTIRQVRDGGVDGNRLAQIEMFDHAKELFSP